MIRSGLITTSLAAALGIASALVLAACGGSDAKLLSGTTAEEINSNLSRVRELAAEGECVDAEDAALEISGQVADLREVDPKLKLALQEGAERLNEVVATCSATESTVPEEAEEEPTTTEAEPSKEQQKEEEKAQKEEEKLQKDAEKEEEKEQKEAEKEAEKEQKEVEKEESEAAKPPKGEAPPPEPPSGGLGPGSEAGD
jgi:hypothetical protein